MKKTIFIAVVLSIGLWVQNLYADPIFAQPGFAHNQYETIDSTGIHQIKLDRKVNKIEIIGISTDTYHFFPYDVLESSVITYGHPDVASAQAVDYATAMAAAATAIDYYLVDSVVNASTANTELTFDVQTDAFTIFVATNTGWVPHTINIRVYGWGW
ncbi:MAG: hypothetical protein WC373_00745 [Smithella sp.]|jgi:hypothetical protein